MLWRRLLRRDGVSYGWRGWIGRVGGRRLCSGRGEEDRQSDWRRRPRDPLLHRWRVIFIQWFHLATEVDVLTEKSEGGTKEGVEIDATLQKWLDLKFQSREMEKVASDFADGLDEDDRSRMSRDEVAAVYALPSQCSELMDNVMEGIRGFLKRSQKICEECRRIQERYPGFYCEICRVRFVRAGLKASPGVKVTKTRLSPVAVYSGLNRKHRELTRVLKRLKEREFPTRVEEWEGRRHRLQLVVDRYLQLERAIVSFVDGLNETEHKGLSRILHEPHQGLRYRMGLLATGLASESYRCASYRHRHCQQCREGLECQGCVASFGMMETWEHPSALNSLSPSSSSLQAFKPLQNIDRMEILPRLLRLIVEFNEFRESAKSGDHWVLEEKDEKWLRLQSFLEESNRLDEEVHRVFTLQAGEEGGPELCEELYGISRLDLQAESRHLQRNISALSTSFFGFVHTQCRECASTHCVGCDEIRVTIRYFIELALFRGASKFYPIQFGGTAPDL